MVARRWAKRRANPRFDLAGHPVIPLNPTWLGFERHRLVGGRPVGEWEFQPHRLQRRIGGLLRSEKRLPLASQFAKQLFDAGEPCGAEANMAKYLAAEAAWEAGNACIDCHGGYGYAEEYDVERKFRECRLYKTAPVNNNLVLAYVGEHVLGMPRSY